ncbi:MAG: O-antigen ligase family protein [Opitutaceae bacterium]|nr:O-antigen ligase family protein [Opitutaceae bacterium]
MTPTRDKLLVIGGGVLAILCGFALANDAWLWPALAFSAGLVAVFLRFAPWPFLPAILLALVLGYFVGNRGFAQLSLSGTLPLFAAEAVLAQGGVVWVWQRAKAGGLDWELRGSHLAVLLWLAYGTARLFPEVRTYGILALRDYAMVYYGGFYFLAWSASRQVDFAPLLLRTIRIGSLILIPLFWLFSFFPEQFVEGLTFRGSPVFFYKADIAGTFLSLGAICWFLHARKLKYSWLGWLVSLGCVGTMLSTHNRASMLGLATGIALLALRGRTEIVKGAMVTAFAGAVALSLWVESGQRRWSQTPVPAILEAIVSIADFEGDRRYQAEVVENKGDNNRFRAVWWRSVIEETLRENPLLGVGYGYDLATPFLRVYYPDSNDDFTARSPHSIFITIFGRLGFLGLALFIAVAASLALKTWQLLGRDDYRETSLPGVCALMILASACFGVVLEGPMGAVVFWICFGSVPSEAARQSR